MTKDAKILDEKEEIQDGLENLIANLGTGADKRAHTRITNDKRLSAVGNEDELENMYQTDWVAGKVVDIIPNDMTREWRSFVSDEDPKKIELLEKEENRLQLANAFNMGHKWSRLYGTGFIVMVFNDSVNPQEPLDISKIKKGSLQHIKPLDRRRLTHNGTICNNPMKPYFGLPEYYKFVDTNVIIHASRLLRFDAIELPYNVLRHNHYWSNSVLDRLYENIIDLSIVLRASATMVFETNVDIVKFKGLMQQLATKQGQDLIRKRFALAKSLKSFNNLFLLDSDEEHETKTNTFAGLPDLIDRYAQVLSAASDIPATRLLGNSANGLNATGEGDLKNYYDMVRSLQNFEYKPHLDIFDQIMAKNLGIDIDDLTYEFNSLFQLSDTEQAQLDLNNAQRDQIYLDHDIVTPSMIAKELKQNDTYTNITDEYIEELEDLEDEDEFNTGSNVFGNTAEGEEKEEGEEGSSNSDPEES